MAETISLEERTYVQDEESNEIKKEIKQMERNDDEPDVKLSKTKFYLVFFALIMSLLMATLNISNVTTALPKICEDLNSYESYSWVITAALLGNTSFQPMLGKFADIFGRKPIMMICLFGFIIASFLCGASVNFGMLIGARALQGITCGGLMSLVNIIIADIVPLKKRGAYMGIIGAVFSFSSVIGPLVGGFLTDNISWRWVFYMNIPFGVVAMIVIYYCINIATPSGSVMEKIKRIDFLGTFLIVCSLLCLLFGMSLGGKDFGWGSPVIITLLICFAILLALFILVEFKYAKEPITPLGLFKTRNVTFSCLVSFFIGIAFIGINNTLPLLYQNGRGISATNSGLRMIPISITSSIATIGSGILIGKFGHLELYMKAGSALSVVAFFLVSRIGIDTMYVVELFILAFIGFSIGLILQNTVLATQQAAPKKYLAIATTSINFFRLIGGVIGISTFNTVIQITFPNQYREEYPDAKKVSIGNIDELKDGRRIYVDAIQDSILYTFFASACIMLVFSLFIKYIPFTKKNQAKNSNNQIEEKDITNISIEKENETEKIDINIELSNTNTDEIKKAENK